MAYNYITMLIPKVVGDIYLSQGTGSSLKAMPSASNAYAVYVGPITSSPMSLPSYYSPRPGRCWVFQGPLLVPALPLFVSGALSVLRRDRGVAVSSTLQQHLPEAQRGRGSVYWHRGRAIRN